MSNISYVQWLGPKDGLLPQRGVESFNNILYTTELLIGKRLTNSVNRDDIKLLRSHFNQTRDWHGLYEPKNSHDNLTAKIIASKLFAPEELQVMSLKQAIKECKHPRDVVLYAFWLGNPIVRFISRLFLIIPALAMIISCLSSGKTRPAFYSSWHHFFNRALIALRLYKDNESIDIFGGKKHTYYFSFKDAYSFNQFQNDGKILAPLRLYVLKDESYLMRLTAKICNAILRRKFGKSYMIQLFANYFREYDHPVNFQWTVAYTQGARFL